MKKGGTMILLLITVMFAAFVAGLLYGRHTSQSPVTIQPIKTEYMASNDSSIDSGTTSGGKVNINTASSVVLDTLPGIGPVLAERIVAYRDANGPFHSIEDLAFVDGIGSKTLLEILNLITVED